MNDKPDSFRCGPFEVSARPDAAQFADKLNRLREAVDMCRLQPGVGYTINRSSNGTTLSIATGGGTSAAVEKYPFQVTTKIKKQSVHYNVYKESGKVANLEIDKLGEDISLGVQKITENYLIILSADISPNPDITRVYIRHQKESENFSDIEPSDKTVALPQTKANLILALITPGGVVQNVHNLVTIAQANAGGFPGYVLFPYGS